MKAERIYLLIIFLTVSTFASGQRYKIPKVVLTDIRLVRALKEYHTAQADVIDVVKGVVIVRYSKLASEKFYLAFKVHKIDVLRDPPSFYSEVDGRVILFYTGIEAHIKFDDRSFRGLLKDAKGRLIEKGVSYDPIVWEVELVGDGHQFKVVPLLPW